MSNYGSKTNADGKSITGNGRSPIIVGQNVTGNKLMDICPATDQNGEMVQGRWAMKFLQSNGATFQHMIFDSDQDWAIDRTNQQILHIATKMISEEDYYAAIGSPANFDGFMRAVSAALMPASAGKLFTLKITYNKSGYPGFPSFPNFIELDGTAPSTLSTNPKYDMYTVPEGDSAEEATTADTEDEPVF